LISASVNNITEDRVVTVATPDDLPVLQTGLTTFPFSSGTIFYVESLNVLVISSKSRWIGFDGRVLRSDFPVVEVYGFGQNNSGQLGDGSSTHRSSPVSVVGGITNWSQVSGGYRHVLGVTADGIAYAWGYNFGGRLGDGTGSGKSSPVTVVGGLTWSQVSGGNIHSLGITSTGVAYAWGNGQNGMLGTGSTSTTSSPVSVVGGLTWKQVSAGKGLGHSVGITTQGVAYAWGTASSGMLGNASTSPDQSSPVTVVGGHTWSTVSAGYQFTLGLTTSGEGLSWGNGSFGKLGILNSTGARTTPTLISGGHTWSQLVAGNNHGFGITTGGIAYAWGYNRYGRLGDGTTTSRTAPVTIVGGITNWSQLSGGGEHSLGVTSDGVAYAWGRNNYGQLGQNDTTNRSSPVTVVGGITNWALAAALGRASIAVTVS